MSQKQQKFISYPILTQFNCICYKWTSFFGHFVTYHKPKTGNEINKNLRKFNKNHNTTKICARFMEVFVLLIKHKGTRAIPLLSMMF